MERARGAQLVRYDATRRQLAAGELVASGCLTRLFILAIEYRIQHGHRCVFALSLAFSLFC